MDSRNLLGSTPAFSLLISSFLAHAQEFPSKRITFVVPFPAGSATDGAARCLAAELSSVANVPVIVDNKPGADRNIAIYGSERYSAIHG